MSGILRDVVLIRDKLREHKLRELDLAGRVDRHWLPLAGGRFRNGTGLVLTRRQLRGLPRVRLGEHTIEGEFGICNAADLR